MKLTGFDSQDSHNDQKKEVITMYNPNCQNCNFKKNTSNGNCTRYKPTDGFSIRCSPPWTIEKYKPINLYCHMLTSKLEKKRKLNYIDLFAGPGQYCDRSSGMIYDGPPLFVLRYDVDHLYLNDINPDNVKALSVRIKKNMGRVTIYNKDVDLVAREINERLSDDSISFCFIDPDDIENFKYDTIKQLSKDREVDLLINFTYGLDYRWSVHSNQNKYNEYFGTDKWRFIEDKYKANDIIFRAHALMKLYIEQLNKIGYLKPPAGREYKNIFPIHNTRQGTLYYLIFASKRREGYEFCKKMRAYTIPWRKLQIDI
ncbi:MAG: hypothetical protein B6D58_00455 [candidate division Zixibacteria bacterium 4484_95]|nr:MAG: hypothetical protein B6D58_00455 [candidate division Zixibacteria bacterium 4484_95]